MRHVVRLCAFIWLASTAALAAGQASSPAAAPAPPASAAPAPAPWKPVAAEAFHVLPETHNNESGYSSLCEGTDGSLYIGTAKYGVDAYLVEFDPATGKQRVVLDTNKVCGLDAKGYAAQAKIHTPNFVGRSGKVYVGSKQGYPTDEDKKADVKYPGGYVMTYDPRIGLAENLGMPMPGQGVIDVVADEDRDLIYAVTCEEQHWMVYSVATKAFREPDPALRLSPYATTLLDGRGGAYALALGSTEAPEAGKDFKPQPFKLAKLDAGSGRPTTRDIRLGGRSYRRDSELSIPQWTLGPDGHTAYLVEIDDATVVSLDLLDASPTVEAVAHGKLIEGEGLDIRSGLTLHPDGKLYALACIANKSGYGPPSVEHLVRFDPQANRSEDLGVMTVSNPGFYAAAAVGPDGNKKPWTHGFAELPDKGLVPIYPMALRAGRDGTLYATQLYPFSLLRIDGFKVAAPPRCPAQDYLEALLKVVGSAEAQLPEMTRVGEVLAKRHLDGGALGALGNSQGLADEITGRSGGIIAMGFDRAWKKDRTDAEKANDIFFAGWNRAPDAADLAALKEQKARGCYIVGFGPKAMPELAEHVKLCDAFFDTGFADDRAIRLPDGTPAGRVNTFANTIHAWALQGEMVGALTRAGKMPAMWMGYNLPGGVAWGEKYLQKKQFHDEFQIGPQPAGSVGGAYLRAVKYHVAAMLRTQLPAIRRAGELVADETVAGRKTWVAWTGHMGPGYLGKFEDARWAVVRELHAFIKAMAESWLKESPEGALVLALDFLGIDKEQAAAFREKKQRVILVTGDHMDPTARRYDGAEAYVYDFVAMGDACVPIEGYPIRILPGTGFAQAAAYEAIEVETAARLAGKK